MHSDPLDGLLIGPRLTHLFNFRLMRAVPPADDQMTALSCPCDTAPVVQVNNDYYENTSVEEINQLMEKLK